MNRKAALCIIFSSFIIPTEGNTVTLLPAGTANVISGKPLSLQCIYSGTNNPFTFNFYLNQDTNGLQIRVSNCIIAIAVGYNTSLYNPTCGTNNVNLTILAVSQEHNGQKWECDVSFTTADPVPPKASTIISITPATTPTTPTTPTIPCPVQFVLAFIPIFFLQCVIAVVIFKCKVFKDAYHLGLGLGLILGILFIVSCIIIVILKFTGTITPCEKEVGLGLGLGSGIPCLIIGILAVIIKFFSCSLCEDDTLTRKPTSTNAEDNPQETDDKKTGQVPLEPIDKKSKTNNSGSSSAVSREHVQMEKKGVKDDEEESPPAVHTGTQNKVEPDSNQTNDRQPPPRPQPPPPQNGETPRPKKLPPLTAKQETVQEVDASEESKKKRKKKKKKDQVNEKTPEEANGETDPRDN